MENRKDNAMEEAMRIARSPAGQQLLQLLQQTGGDQLQQAMAMAAMGNYAQAKDAISQLLDTPEAKKLLSQLGR